MNDFCPAVRSPSCPFPEVSAFSLLVLVPDLETACSELPHLPPSLPFHLPFPACVQPPRCPRKPFSREPSWLPVLAPSGPATRSLGSSDQEPGLLLLGSFGLWMDGSPGHLKMWLGRAVLGAGSRLFPRLQLQSVAGMMGKGRERRSRRGPGWLPGGEGGLRNQSVCTEPGALPRFMCPGLKTWCGTWLGTEFCVSLSPQVVVPTLGRWAGAGETGLPPHSGSSVAAPWGFSRGLFFLQEASGTRSVLWLLVFPGDLPTKWAGGGLHGLVACLMAGA